MDDDQLHFSEFYRTEFATLVGFVMKAVGATVYEGTDAAQAALTEAWAKWGTLFNPRAWVRTVAIRAYYRSVPVREVSLDHHPEVLDLVATDCPVELSERTAAAHALLELLPPAQRIVLAYSTDGFSDAEIAAELGKSLEAVRQNRHRARKTLKSLLQTQSREVTHDDSASRVPRRVG
ncbi:MAG TPA: RNA polymerase sigma factor [Actinophytocola sp.]|uniref:RNA polymerase sigma factor n=1 Tax=Actinophytocola sp. TaxID=1872138 RepID=UPI002DDCE04B|nr:RNA polymerase sigma factor [Actinophytocola sp.]HEV2779669.1 RNA polymerase sigma factor [Actinophytocola sp.]